MLKRGRRTLSRSCPRLSRKLQAFRCEIKSGANIRKNCRMANTCPADTAASRTKQAFALRFPIAVRTCVPYVSFLPLRNVRFASRSLLSCCFACPLWAYAHERRPFFSRAQTLFIVSANLFSRDEKPLPPNVVATKGYAARLLANAYSFAFARVSKGQAAVVAL